MLKKILYIIAAASLAALGKYLLGNDFIPFLQWWVSVLGLGLIFMPMADKLFSSLKDKGYLFSKTIAIAVTGYLTWLSASLNILKFSETSCYVSVAIGVLMNLAIVIYNRKAETAGKKSRKVSFFAANKGLLDTIIVQELLFFALFLIFTYVRGFKPDAHSTEKFMDYGFMTSMMRSSGMPPQDFWFSGSKLNYYYVGQFLATYLSRLSFVKVSLGYNLALMMIGAFAFVLPCSLVYNLFLNYSWSHAGKSRVLPVLSALLGGMAVCIAGNMHYPIYQWFIPLFRKILHMKKSDYKYWFPDATRYIGYNPVTHDKTIHEFPCYSFVLGDLHAHVINILFILTVLAILLAWMFTAYNRRNEHKPVIHEVFNPGILMIGFFIGLFHTTNFWDFPIYFVVSGAIILFSNMVVYNFKVKSLWLTALQGIVVFAVSEIVSLPFTLKFDQISTNICLVDTSTPFYQLLVLWGLPVFTVIAFLIFLIADFNRKKRKKSNPANPVKKSGFIHFINSIAGAVRRFMDDMPVSDLFVITIGLCAIGLVLLPEIIYVQDIYSGDYKRANTMFKLTYQAFIMFGICFGYIFPRLLRFGKTILQKVTAAVGLILLVLTICYVQNAVKGWYGNIFNKKNYKGIDCTSFIKTDLPDDYSAIQWLNENISGAPVILEANGESYTDYERVSVFTGLPTVLGWYTHERLWKSDNLEIINKRAEDIKTIYTAVDKDGNSVSEDEIRKLIKQYNISYIYIGSLEKEKYGTINEDMLKKLGTVVYQIPDTDKGAFRTYIIKTD